MNIQIGSDGIELELKARLVLPNLNPSPDMDVSGLWLKQAGYSVGGGVVTYNADGKISYSNTAGSGLDYLVIDDAQILPPLVKMDDALTFNRPVRVILNIENFIDAGGGGGQINVYAKFTSGSTPHILGDGEFPFNILNLSNGDPTNPDYNFWIEINKLVNDGQPFSFDIVPALIINDLS